MKHVGEKISLIQDTWKSFKQKLQRIKNRDFLLKIFFLPSNREWIFFREKRKECRFFLGMIINTEKIFQHSIGNILIILQREIQIFSRRLELSRWSGRNPSPSQCGNYAITLADRNTFPRSISIYFYHYQHMFFTNSLTDRFQTHYSIHSNSTWKRFANQVNPPSS